jgi:sec-independent protein translocase protein TatC
VTEESMSLVDHLDELRRRTIFSLVAALLGLIVAYYCYNPVLLDLLTAPLDALAGKDNPFVWAENPILKVLLEHVTREQQTELDLRFVNLTEGFMVKIKTAFVAGLIIASPLIIYQLWQFISAGLKAHERRAINIYLPVSLVLFLTGVLLAYFFMLPIVVYFLIFAGGAGLTPTLTVSGYVAPVAYCCLGAGVVFQLPLVILFLTSVGIVTPMFLRKRRRYAILLMFVVGAMLTPPDVITQVMLALPMILLYEAGIVVSKFAWARRQKRLEG